jgi:hypothetical protein
VKEYLRQLIEDHRSPGIIIIDANLLILLVVGARSPVQIEHFKPTSSHFVSEDYSRLNDILSGIDRFVVTPHILTEVSNFLGKASSKADTLEYRHILAESIERFDIQDVQISAIMGTSDDKQLFRKLGLTDAGIIYLARKGYLAITVDFELAQYIQSDGHDSINYMHVSCANITEKKWR